LVRENVAFLSGTASEIRYFATRETPHVEVGRVSRNKITVVFWLEVVHQRILIALSIMFFFLKTVAQKPPVSMQM
jgi:hypothetical protein